MAKLEVFSTPRNRNRTGRKGSTMGFRYTHVWLIAMMLPLLSCGGDPASSRNTDLSGIWIGSQTTTTASPPGHPLTQAVASAIGEAYQSTVTFSQSGSSLSITWKFDNTGLKTMYSGSVDGQVFTADMTGSDALWLIDMELPGGVLMDVQYAVGSVTGSVEQNTMSGTFADTLQCYDSATDAPAGVVHVGGTFSLSH